MVEESWNSAVIYLIKWPIRFLWNTPSYVSLTPNCCVCLLMWLSTDSTCARLTEIATCYLVRFPHQSGTEQHSHVTGIFSWHQLSGKQCVCEMGFRNLSSHKSFDTEISLLIHAHDRPQPHIMSLIGVKETRKAQGLSETSSIREKLICSVWRTNGELSLCAVVLATLAIDC